jgi:hypothetical protein
MNKTEMLGRFSATLLAAGVLAPEKANADIILGDPGFENFVVPPFPPAGYAYSDTYRPTSAWVDDLDHNSGGYVQDDGESNWLYNAAYAENPIFTRRAAPRTGDQAMHGQFHYNAQESSAVFEAGMTYTFSIWAQGDEDASPASSRVFLYIFDGSVPFSEANSLASRRFAPDTGDFINRPLGSTPQESRAAWMQISLQHTVLPGAPEIGHPVGVGFWMAGDGALDDATLVAVPGPGVLVCFAMGAMPLMTRRRRGDRVT